MKTRKVRASWSGLWMCGVFMGALLQSGAGYAQEPTETKVVSAADEPGDMSGFDDYFHTYNSDYQYYFMRHRMRLNKVLTSVSVNQQQSGATDTEIKSFLPVYYGDDFAFLLPFYFYRFPLTPTQEEEVPFEAIHNFFWQAIFNVNLSDNLTLAAITESHHIGTESSQLSLVGNDVAEFVVLSWELSPSLTIAPAARVKLAWDSDRQRQWEATPAGHVIWRPSKNLALMTGLPSLLAIEWEGPSQLDVATHVMLGEGNINAMAAVRKGLGGGFATTLRGIRDGYEGIYVPEFTRRVENEDAVINQVSQYKNRVQLELEYHPTSTAMLQVKGGYGFDEGVTLKRDDVDIATLSGEDGFYGGVTLTTFYGLDP